MAAPITESNGRLSRSGSGDEHATGSVAAHHERTAS